MNSKNIKAHKAAEPEELSQARPKADKTGADPTTLSPEEIRQMVHDLEVHQIELAMQNEELRRAREELDASRARYFDLYDLAPVGYVTLSEQGLILEANLTASNQLNVPRSVLAKQPIVRFILKEDQDIYYRHRKALFETGEPQVCRLRMVKTGHLPLWVRLDAIAARHEDGTLVCRVVMSDIAENKRMEMALRESEERYKRITHAITDYVYTVHMENGTAVSTAHGPGCLAVTGYHENEFAQDPFLWLGIVVPEDRDRVIEHAKRAAAGEETQPLEHRILRKDEEIRWVRNTTVPHRDGYGVIVSYDGLIQDITEHKLLEGQFHQAQKMESVGRLAGGVAHDFNNMLSVIIGYGELAMEKMDPADSLHGDLREILNAAERSTAIVRQLLAFARKQTIVPEVLDLNETIEGMLKMLRRLIGEDIDLAWLPETGLWPIRMDPSQIDQILANLCVNARDAIAGVGKITIETGRASFDEVYCADNIDCAPGDFALLTVNDNGCGMDKEILANLFEPFFTTKRAGEGTGLGLATVYGIIKQNNGFIHVDSEPGKGTTFEIYLPRHEGEAGMISVDSSQPISRGRGETVLMVEDEKAILTLGKTMLENLGYTVLGANSPEDALTLAREHTDEIQLLVTDVIMPGMNGLDLAEQLIVLYPEIKVLFMSGYTATTIAHHGVLDEGVRFLPKPFSMQDIATKVREALDQE